jgi:phosphatidylglycerol---prolipoprotein diacylglyceryl transferase
MLSGIFDFALPLGPISVSSHFFLESLAYMAGFALYRRERQRAGDFLPAPDRSSLIVAAILGAAIGSKVLTWFEDPSLTLQHWSDLSFLMGGKSIVGGLLGGTMAVEWTKSRLGITRRTGDLLTLPILLGMMIGRVGCFLAGLRDHTFGIPTTLPWGIDFGDGIPRHPTQLYEMLFLILLAALLLRLRAAPHQEGDLFRVFLISYFAWRLGIDFLKPDPRFAGLSSIQWCCAAALLWYGRDAKALLLNRTASEARG